MLPTSALAPNSSFSIGDPRVSSLMFYVGENGGNIMGFLGDGELTFGDEVDLTSGGTLVGELSVDIWGWVPAAD